MKVTGEFADFVCNFLQIDVKWELEKVRKVLEMYPVAFDGVTKILTPPVNWDESNHGSCSNLPIRFENGLCKSCWKFGWKEFFKFLFKRKIYLYVASGDTQPPVKLMVE